MSSRTIFSGIPAVETVEIDLDRYDKLLHAEVKCEQYKTAFEKLAPLTVAIIEAFDPAIHDLNDESEVENE